MRPLLPVQAQQTADLSLRAVAVAYFAHKAKGAALSEAGGNEDLLTDRYSLWKDVTPAAQHGQFTVPEPAAEPSPVPATSG